MIDRLTLRFDDPDLERAYREKRELAFGPDLVRAGAFAAILWAISGVILVQVAPDHARALGGLAAAMAVANVIGTLVVLRARALRPKVYMVMTLNAAAGLSVLAMAARTGLDDAVAPALILMGIYGFFYAQLSFFHAAIAVIPQLITFTWLVLVGGYATVLALFLAWASTAVTGLAAHALEARTREVFRQQRVIEEQGRELALEKAKSDRLLANMLPAAVAARLREDPSALAEAFDEVSVLFADLVGFTTLATTVSATELVKLLDGMFSRFDELAVKHGVEKVKTIGDAYMLVGGCPERSADHVERTAAMGLAMVAELRRFAEERGLPLALRVGMHTGPVVAGVIGTRRFSFDLWGDTVNTASRMESHGVPGRVQVSPAVRARLGDRYAVEERGAIAIKGKGEMHTFLLVEPSG